MILSKSYKNINYINRLTLSVCNIKKYNITTEIHGYSCLCCINNYNTNKYNKNKINTSLIRNGSSLASSNIEKASPYVRKLLENNKKWANETSLKDPQFFNKISNTQKPKYLYIGCSDSRVPDSDILGLGPGDLFVSRNIGNIFSGSDLNSLSVLEYAVDHLGVTDIIVTGHYDCGAVRAASKRQDLGTLEHWLRHIRDVYRLHKDILDLIENDEERHRTLVELNIIEQCINIYKNGIFQRKRIESTKEYISKGIHDDYILENNVYPRIHGLVFDPSDGILRKLKIEFKKRVGSLDHIYGLYNHSP